MFKTILIILLLSLSVLIGNQLQQDPGYVYIAINHYTLETTLWFALLLIVLTLGSVAIMTALILKIIRIPQKIKVWLTKHQLAKKQRPSWQELQALQEHVFETTLLHLIQEKNTQALEPFITQLPKASRHNPRFVIPYCQYLINNNQINKAEDRLRSELKRAFHDDFIHLYGTFSINATQLDFAESLLKKNPHSAPLMLALGRLCIHHHLWGKAIHYLEHSIELAPTQEAYVELGKLYERLNREEQACETYKRGLLL